MTVVGVAPLALINDVIEILRFTAIRYQESPLTTEYVAAGHAGFAGATARAIWHTGTIPATNTMMANSHRPRVDAAGEPVSLIRSDTDTMRASLRRL